MKRRLYCLLLAIIMTMSSVELPVYAVNCTQETEIINDYLTLEVNDKENLKNEEIDVTEENSVNKDMEIKQENILEDESLDYEQISVGVDSEEEDDFFETCEVVSLDSIVDEKLRETIRNYDSDKDGQLSEKEMYSMDYLYIQTEGIETIEGLEQIPTINTLILSYKVKECDISGFATLETFCIRDVYGDEDIEGLNLNNKYLKELRLQFDEKSSITTLDISGCENLESLAVQGVKTLDISKNTQLTGLEITGDVEIDVENNAPLLSFFWMENGKQYTTLSLGDKPYLSTIRIYSSTMDTLDISGCPNISIASFGIKGLKNMMVAKECNIGIIENWSVDYTAEPTKVYVHRGSYMDLWINLYEPYYNLCTAYYETENPVCQVTFVLDYGQEKTVEYEKNSVLPNVFERIFMNEWGDFEGWYLDETFTQPFQMTTPITEDMVLYGKWDMNFDDTEMVINEENFPDASFREFLFALFGESISKYEILGTTVFNNTDYESKTYNLGKDIIDLTGIEYFKELQEISMGMDKLAKADFSQNKKLVRVHIYGSKTSSSSIQFGEHPLLKYLQIGLRDMSTYPSIPNDMKYINLSGMPNLETLIISDFSLETLDISNLTNLIVMQLYESKIKTLDTSNNLKLKELQLTDNEMLRNIDLSNNVNLEKFHISRSQIGSLDLSKLKKLENLGLSWEETITNLDLTHNTNLRYFEVYNTPVSKIDLSKNVMLETLQLGIKLKQVDLSHNPKINHISLYMAEDGMVKVLKGSEVENYCIMNKIPCTYGELPLLGVYTVTFDTMGGTPEVQEQKIEKDCYVVEPYVIPEKANNVFTGWYVDASATKKWIFNEHTVTKNMTLYAGYQRNEGDKIEVATIENVIYTGKALKPKVTITSGDIELVENKDYKVSYKNNIKACQNADDVFDSKKPYIVVTGKGNYKGSIKMNFNILPKEITETEISYPTTVIAKTNNVEQGNQIKVSYNKKKLKENIDYTLSVRYAESVDGNYTEVNNSKLSTPGYYKISILGKNNFKGTKEVEIFVAEAGVVNLSSAKISVVSGVNYNVSEENPLGYDGNYDQNSSEEEKMMIANIIKYVKVGNKSLTFGDDYKVSVTGSTAVGKASVTISAVEGNTVYVGKKTAVLNVKGIPLKASEFEISGIENKSYEGTEESIQQKDITVLKKSDNTTLTEKVDYEIQYKNNHKAGTAKIMIKGIGGYTGTITKSYKINAIDISKVDEFSYIKDVVEEQNRKGATPDLQWKYKDYILQSGVDCTVKYSNNKNVTTSTKKANATITGKGYFKGKVICEYDISAKEISDEEITYIVDAVAYSSSKKIYQPKITVYDNGVKLKANKDYVIIYDTSEEAEVTEMPTEEVIRNFKIVTIKDGRVLNGCYTGERVGEFKVSAMLMKSMKASVISKVVYTGKPVELDESEISVSYKKGGETIVLKPGDFKIVEYTGNNKAGNAKVVIEGTGKYGGKKAISFKISAKNL